MSDLLGLREFKEARRDWVKKAACSGLTGLFFPETGGLAHATVQSAKAVCASCPVRDECLEWWLEMSHIADESGVVGGTTPQERRKIKAERKRAVAA